MVWVDAASYVAEVIQLQAVRDFAYIKFIRKTMSYCQAPRNLNPRIPMLIVIADAKPASSIWLWEYQARVHI